VKIIASNKRASFDYFLLQKFEAGVLLAGSEVKSIRNGGISINESFVNIENDEIFLKNAYIKPYDKAKSYIPETKRTRKLLLNRREIDKIAKERQAGLTIVPTKVYLKNGFVKVEIALAKGKKNYDKRHSLAEKTAKREIARHLKEQN